MWLFSSKRFKLLKTIALLIVFIYLLYLYLPYDWLKRTKIGVQFRQWMAGDAVFYNTCHRPKYDPWNEEMLEHIDMNFNPVSNCDKTFKPFTKLENGHWSIVDEKTKCRARCQRYKGERENDIGDWMDKAGPVDCEILETVCSNETHKDMYGFLHSQIIETPLDPPKKNISGMQQFDVVVILLDSLSYTQAVRSLPSTRSFFKSHMEAIEFPYLNKVGENSRPNSVALWYGKSLESIDRSLYDEESIDEDWKHEYFCYEFKDNETHLFKEFHEHGYKTMLAEDWAEGSANWPDCVGFKNPPTDHYMRPFQYAYEKVAENITKKHLEGHLCREYHHTLFDYLEQFQNSYTDNVPKFSWFWSAHIGHDDENGFFRVDRELQQYLFKNRKKLENSFVFILGDHGLRFGDQTETTTGSFEKNNPYLGISIPKELRDSTDLLKMMEMNAKDLQTHYDTRATFLDILKYQSKSGFLETETLDIPEEKGHSLFRHQPNSTRTCRTLPIPTEYCICQFDIVEEDSTSSLAENIGKAVIDSINSKLKQGGFEDKCTVMEFEKTLSLKKFKNTFDGFYSINLKVKGESGATFKANVEAKNMFSIIIHGTIERTSIYGRTADCIKSEVHRPFCYCREQPKKVSFL
ncbi:unnamed protein product [Caenorhabditis angaria]|uniref:Uncharacterized protein n=1 Tax=Caenorhabditis angaria TaxID=860376 RepID=A0A9P1IG45_9PELO|nr:unnamed protein product [Caenorhabditis angaria]